MMADVIDVAMAVFQLGVFVKVSWGWTSLAKDNPTQRWRVALFLPVRLRWRWCWFFFCATSLDSWFPVVCSDVGFKTRPRVVVYCGWCRFVCVFVYRANGNLEVKKGIFVYWNRPIFSSFTWEKTVIKIRFSSYIKVNPRNNWRSILK